MNIHTPNVLETELSQMGVMQLLEEDQPEMAASLVYQWLLKEALPAERMQNTETASLYDMLSYLIERGILFGFTYESKIEEGNVIFTIRNIKLQKSRVIPILLELLLAQICEQHCNIHGEITQSGNDTIVKIKLT